MFPTTQNASPRARLILARHALKSNLLVSNNTVLRSSSNGQQSRQLCRSNLPREGRRRHRMFANRSVDSLNRHLSWDNSPKIDNSKAAARKVAAGWLQPSNSATKYTNLNDVKSWSDDVSGLRPGRSIEDVERDAINHLFHKDDTVWAPLQNIRNFLHTSRNDNQVTAEKVLQATTSVGDDTDFIDPITNRRMPRAEQAKYFTTQLDDPDTPRKLTSEEKSKLYQNVGEYTSATWKEPNGLPDLTPEEQSKNYKDLDGYFSTKLDNPNAPRKLTLEESKIYDDVDKYEQPVVWNEPDGLQEPTSEEQSKNYADLDKYGPVRWHEPDGLQEPTSEEKTKNYMDLRKYEAVKWNEPDGLRRLTPEEKSKNYTDLHAYSGPFLAKNSLLKAHEALQNDPTPKGKPLPARPEVHTEAMTTQYEDLYRYGPVHWNEPDGLRPPTSEESSKEYEDLHQYARYDNAGPKTLRVHPEEESKQYQDLPSYAAFPNAGPETERIHPEEASKRYKDLHAYPVDGYVEPEKTRHIHPEELTKNYADLVKYGPQIFDSPEKTYPIHPEEVSKAYQDLHHYEMASPDASNLAEIPDAIAAGRGPFDSKVQLRAEIAASAAKRRRNRHSTGLDESSDKAADSMTADGIRTQVMRRASAGEAESVRSLERDEVEMSSMDESFPSEESKSASASIDHISNKLAKMRAENDPYSSDPKGLETSYTEECGRETEPSLSKHYDAKGSGSDKAAATEEPAIYKVLAYDAATQSVSIAETTSSDHGTSSPLKLADVLLQLSHPSKFLPYFQPLQAHGYDIVSGGGDVLIFRKTRASAANAGDFPAPSIGGTARPVDPERKKRSLGKKVVMGTVGVGGVAYAVGALGEYLSIGGK